MVETADSEDYAINKFFFAVIHSITDSYPTVFSAAKRNKLHAAEYSDFQSKWGVIGTLYQIADEKIEAVGKISQLYLTDFLQFLSYLIEKSIAEEAEDKFQRTREKLQRRR